MLDLYYSRLIAMSIIIIKNIELIIYLLFYHI